MTMPPVREAIDRVLARGWFVLGPELEAFETEFAAASGTNHAIGVGTGTDAIALALRALGIGPGDEVITTPLSAAFTALAIMMAGATPVFADLDPDRLTLDPDAAAAAITPRTAALLPVHLYGQPADMPRLQAVAGRHGIATHRRCLPGASGDLRGPARRDVRAGRSLQLLSHEEPRSAGRRRGHRDQR